MKKVGWVLMLVGGISLFCYFSMSTAVTTEEKYLGGGVTIPSMTVNNFGLMEERRNGMTMSGIAILAGVILFVAGTIHDTKATLSQRSTFHPTTRRSTDAKTRKCPFCAEEIKPEAIICRFCNRDLPPLAAEENELAELRKNGEKIPPLTPEQLAELRTNPQRLAAVYGIERDGNLFKVHGKYFERLFDAVAFAEIKALKSKLGDAKEAGDPVSEGR